MIKRLRAVVLGCGNIGALFEAERGRAKPASHAGAIKENRDTKLAALADPDASRRARAKKLFPDAKNYASSLSCIREERPDVVCIAAPSSARLSLISQCVRAGVRMIVCEKPLAMNLREALLIRNVIENSRTTFVLNYQRRFSPIFKKAREDIAKGRIGRVQNVACRYSNGLFNNGGHMVDSLLFLLNESVQNVYAVENKKNATRPKGDINADAIMTTKSGAAIFLESCDQRFFAVHDMTIFGERGAIAISDFGQSAHWYFPKRSSFRGLRSLPEKPSRSIRAPLSATEGALREAILCEKRRRAPRSGIENGLAVVRILEKIRESAGRNGRRARI